MSVLSAQPPTDQSPPDPSALGGAMPGGAAAKLRGGGANGGPPGGHKKGEGTSDAELRDEAKQLNELPIRPGDPAPQIPSVVMGFLLKAFSITLGYRFGLKAITQNQLDLSKKIIDGLGRTGGGLGAAGAAAPPSGPPPSGAAASLAGGPAPPPPPAMPPPVM